MNLPAAAGSKITKRESFKQVEKSKRKKQPEYKHPGLALPELPPQMQYVWDWFKEVSNGERLTWQEIGSWQKLTHKEITSNEAAAIRDLSFVQHRISNTPQ